MKKCCRPKAWSTTAAGPRLPPAGGGATMGPLRNEPPAAARWPMAGIFSGVKRLFGGDDRPNNIFFIVFDSFETGNTVVNNDS